MTYELNFIRLQNCHHKFIWNLYGLLSFFIWLSETYDSFNESIVDLGKL